MSPKTPSSATIRRCLSIQRYTICGLTILRYVCVKIFRIADKPISDGRVTKALFLLTRAPGSRPSHWRVCCTCKMHEHQLNVDEDGRNAKVCKSNILKTSNFSKDIQWIKSADQFASTKTQALCHCVLSWCSLLKATHDYPCPPEIKP